MLTKDTALQKQLLKKRLIHYLDRNMSGFGKIPPVRELSVTMGVGIRMLRDIIAELESEGYLETRPRSGTFMRNTRPKYKIGIVLEESSPLLNHVYSCMVSTALDIFSRFPGMVVRLLCVRSVSEIPELIQRHNIDAAIWFPEGALNSAFFKCFPDFENSRLIIGNDPVGYAKELSGIEKNVVTHDFEFETRSKAAALAEKGYKKYIYISTKIYDSSDVFMDELSKYGIGGDSVALINSAGEIHSKLPEMIRSGKYDIIAANGFWGFYEELFNVLSCEKEYPDVLIYKTMSSMLMAEKYPSLKIRHIMDLRPIRVEIASECARAALKIAESGKSAERVNIKINYDLDKNLCVPVDENSCNLLNN